MNDGDIRYRAAVSADAQAVFDMVCELADYERMRADVISSPAHFKDIIAQCGNGGRFFCYIAETPAGPVGFCIGHYTLSTFLGRPGLYIEDIYVREAFRNRGTGKRFFALVCQKALDENCGRVEWSVLDWNEPSIEFYKKLGASHLSEWDRYRLDGDRIAAVAARAA